MARFLANNHGLAIVTKRAVWSLGWNVWGFDGHDGHGLLVHLFPCRIFKW